MKKFMLIILFPITLFSCSDDSSEVEPVDPGYENPNYNVDAGYGNSPSTIDPGYGNDFGE
ncbi:MULTISPECIES: hypothetical protein [Flammeovirga]|uniref:Uncharacterized protein n=1 Tax=Flammeovirga agarivorans TaxID=2726742 RepID=A0A7X8SGJ0_9BACT|nr:MULTISPECIES: hypothetical protein [Flammeovirga]NLR89835.1 hypothetical protein [Flammeovirga agarivorans]